jgi:hypothetical protein
MEINKQKNNILVKINDKILLFKRSYKIADFFNDDENIKNIEGLTDEIKSILIKPHCVQRILTPIRAGEQKFLKKTKKYNIEGFTLMKI